MEVDYSRTKHGLSWHERTDGIERRTMASDGRNVLERNMHDTLLDVGSPANLFALVDEHDAPQSC